MHIGITDSSHSFAFLFVSPSEARVRMGGAAFGMRSVVKDSVQLCIRLVAFSDADIDGYGMVKMRRKWRGSTPFPYDGNRGGPGANRCCVNRPNINI